MNTNEYSDAHCPDCRNTINGYGFCENCGFDYEEELMATDAIWEELSDEGSIWNGETNARSTGPAGSDNWLDVFRQNQRP